MTDKKLLDVLKKQHYSIVGNHSAVQICRWNKKSLLNDGFCYKQKFYGIESHRCCQMSCVLENCQNRCLHCWRAIELTSGDKFKGKCDNPVEIIDKCIKAQQKMLTGFKGNEKVNMKKWKEAQEPMNFAISLIGEPTLYPKLGELIKELRKRGKSSFLVTNGLLPEVLKKLAKEKALPTQLYVSLNYPNEEIFRRLTQNKTKNAWKKFDETLELLPKLKTRKVLRMTLVRDLNMEDVEGYAKLIKKAKPDFVECKGYVSVGFARQRLGYDRMPTIEEIRKFAKELASKLKKEGYKILDEHEFSKIVLIGRDKKRMKIKKGDI